MSGGEFKDESLQPYERQAAEHELLTREEEINLAQSMEAGLVAEARLNGDESITRIEAEKLSVIAESGKKSKDRFVSSNLRLVISVARKHKRGAEQLDMADLVQDGNVGLIKATEKYDWHRGFKFSTVATYWIRNSIQTGIANNYRTIRIPMKRHDKLRGLHAAKNNIGLDTITPEVIEESGIDISPEELKVITRVSDTFSIDAPVESLNGNSSENYADILAIDEGSNSVDELIEKGHDIQIVRSAVEVLRADNAVYAEILSLRYGLDGQGSRTIEQCMEITGLLKYKVSKFDTEAREALRIILESYPVSTAS